jgi:hypothetical protein
MTIIYVTTGAWGSGSGTPNSAAQVDGNFYDVDQRIVDLVADVAEGKRIDSVTYTDISMTFHFTDSSSQVIPLPIANLQFVGEWTNDTPYIRGHIISAGVGYYQVLESHTTPPIPALFDPNATDETTDQNPLYQLFLTVVGLPTEGETGQFLRKLSAGNYDADWQDVALDDLSDVEISTSPATGDVLTFSGGTWSNAAGPADTLDDLSDVELSTSPVDGHVLTFTDGAWTDAAVSSGAVSTTASAAIDPVLTDASKYFRCTSSTDITVTIPLHATVAFPSGTVLKFRQCSSTGTVILAGEGAVVLNPIDGYLTETAQEGAVIEAIKIDDDEWDVYGLLREDVSA